MVHPQHIGPFGEFRIPKKPRFKFDLKLYRPVSVVSGIEVVDHDNTGRREGLTTSDFLVRVDDKLFAFSGDFASEFDIDGQRIDTEPTYVAGRFSAVKHTINKCVWENISVCNTYKNYEYTKQIEKNWSLNNFAGFREQLIIEFMALNIKYDGFSAVKRLIFNKSEKIHPKNIVIIGE
jgi:hypothetical protein